MHKKIFGLILIDQITKLIFSGRDFFFGPLHVHLIKNYGLGFSLNFGPLINIGVIVLALIFFILYYWQNRMNVSSIGKIIFVLILSGAISNIIDRLYFGFVRDFLDLGLGFTFNLADLMIVLGLVGLLFTQPIRKAIIDT